MPPKKSDEVIEAEFVEHPRDSDEDDAEESVDVEWDGEAENLCIAETDPDLLEALDDVAPFSVEEVHWARAYITLPSTDGYRIVLPTPFDGLCVGVELDLDDLVQRIAPEVAKAVAGTGLQRAGEGALHQLIRRIIPGLR